MANTDTRSHRSTDTEHVEVVLPYWVQDHIHGQTKFLIRTWLEWKSKNGFKPGTLYQRKGTSNCEWWKVEEMGYAYQKPDEQKQGRHVAAGKPAPKTVR